MIKHLLSNCLLRKVMIFNFWLAGQALVGQTSRSWSLDVRLSTDGVMNPETRNVAPQVVFAGADHIVVGYSFSPEGKTQSYLRLVSIDVTTHEAIATKLFPSATNASTVLKTSSNTFIYSDADSLSIYDVDLNRIKGITLGPPACMEPSVVTPITPKVCRSDLIQRSDSVPSGDRVLIQSKDGTNRALWQWFSTRDLSIVSQFEGDAVRHFHASDSSFLEEQERGEHKLVSKSATKPLCHRCWKAYFLPSGLTLQDYGNSLLVGTAESSFRSLPTDGIGPALVASSCCSPRFVYGLATFGGIPTIGWRGKTTLKLKVIDSTTLRQVDQVIVNNNANQPFDAGLSQSAVALSPDGHALALVQDSTVTYFRLK